LKANKNLEVSRVKINNKMTTFWETMLLLTLKRQDFKQFLLKNCSIWSGSGSESGSGTGIETFPKSEPRDPQNCQKGIATFVTLP
jgi:hypothetical protein